MKKNCEKGTIIACHSGDVMVLAGCKILSMISTFHDNSTYTGTSAGEEWGALRLKLKGRCAAEGGTIFWVRVPVVTIFRPLSHSKHNPHSLGSKAGSTLVSSGIQPVFSPDSGSTLSHGSDFVSGSTDPLLIFEVRKGEKHRRGGPGLSHHSLLLRITVLRQVRNGALLHGARAVRRIASRTIFVDCYTSHDGTLIGSYNYTTFHGVTFGAPTAHRCDQEVRTRVEVSCDSLRQGDPNGSPVRESYAQRINKPIGRVQYNCRQPLADSVNHNQTSGVFGPCKLDTPRAYGCVGDSSGILSPSAHKEKTKKTLWDCRGKAIA
ncbi:hypothetical protein EVAR_20917_1 [Eumeta japonica]|uniref:Uncharacterized protein n=1 Tax=Eumeta variegata TaxID=151549 RepID=A0A4C1UXH4_EUMVA|nr:hypothetical protein EVAR_20917_1 [Eumeta japonica]